MKVMHLTLSDGVGGLELYLLRSVAALSQAGHEVVAVVAPGTLLQQRLRAMSLPFLLLTSSFYRLPLLAAWRLARLLEEQQIDILHLHWAKDLLLGVLAKRLSKRPVRLVFTRQMMLTRPKRDIYHRFLYRHVDLYLTITQQLTELAQQFLPLAKRRIQTLYYGVEAPLPLTPAQRQQWRQQLGAAEEGQFLVGLVGRLEASKGQHLLLQAVAALAGEFPQLHLCFIGPQMNSHYLDELQQLAQHLGVSGQVTFYGAHPNPVALMAAFEVLVLASKEETFGLVLIEAMRAGVAVIGSHAGGVPEIIDEGENGLTFHPAAADDLARQLRRLLLDTALRQRLATAGQAKADRCFNHELHYQRLWQHYTQTTLEI
ncbi:MAG: glycosyltransferase [Gammaproteobacteria bacterium]|nr:glycosyltransferase [Gammaproteobacteria bacterium]